MGGTLTSPNKIKDVYTKLVFYENGTLKFDNGTSDVNITSATGFSTDITLSGSYDYLTASGSTITLHQINLTTDVTGTLPVAKGGTGLTSISTLLNSNVTPATLGLVIGTNVQAYDAGLLSIAALTTAADKMIYTTGSDTYAVTALTAQARALLDDANAGAMRTTLGVDPAGTDNSTNVTLAGARNYITISGQEITRNVIDISDDTNLAASTGVTLSGDTLTTNDSQIVHDNLSGFVANEHIDHSAVSIASGTGLTGGGNITSTRTLAIDATVATLSGTQTLTNKTINASNNTLSNIGNGSLSNSSVNYGGITVALGASDTTPAFNLTDATGLPILAGTTGTLSLARGGTGATSASAARGTLNVDVAGTDNSTNVTLVTSSHNYLSISGQAITLGPIDIGDDTNLAGGIGVDLTNDTLSVDLNELGTNTTMAQDDFITIVKADNSSKKILYSVVEDKVYANVSGVITIASNGVAGIADNAVVLGTNTVGNYVETITGTANKITVSNSGSEGADVVLTLPSDVQIANDLTVAGDLTVNGDLTYLDTTNLKIEDNLFELNANLTGTPVNDSGMLIQRGNQHNAIFMWDESADKFTLGLTQANGASTGDIVLSAVGTLVAALEGNASTATKLATARGITATGDIAWAVSFDGSAAVSANSEIQSNVINDGMIASNAAINTSKLLNVASDTNILTALGGKLENLTTGSGLSLDSGTIYNGSGAKQISVDGLTLANFNPDVVIINLETGVVKNDARILTSLATDTLITSKGYTTNTGTVTSVTVAGGNGLTSSGSAITSSGTITLNVVAASDGGLAVASDSVSLDINNLVLLNEPAATNDLISIYDSSTTTNKKLEISNLPFTNNAGTVTNVVAGTGLSGGGTSTATLDLDFSDLTDMTGVISGATEFILQNGTVESRKAASEIELSYFSNNSGWTSNAGTVTSVTAGTGMTQSGTSTVNPTINVIGTNGLVASADAIGLDISTLTAATSIVDEDLLAVEIAVGGAIKKISATTLKTYIGAGDITSVVAGTGLTGGATSGAATLNIGAGTGIDVAADAISVDVSDFMANGSNNRILTATGTDAMNAESNLTFDGTDLAIAATGKIYLDGGSHTYISEYSNDNLGFYVGGNLVATMTASQDLIVEDNIAVKDGNKFIAGNGSDYEIYANADGATYHKNITQDADIRFQVNDGGSTITALKIDSSDVGSVLLPNDGQHLKLGVGGDLGFYVNADDSSVIRTWTSDKDLYFYVNDGGVATPAIQIDASDAGTAIFNQDIRLNTNATYLYSKDASGTSTRMFGINGSNTTYIGPIDNYAGGNIIYGANANVDDLRFLYCWYT